MFGRGLQTRWSHREFTWLGVCHGVMLFVVPKTFLNKKMDLAFLRNSLVGRHCNMLSLKSIIVTMNFANV